MKNTLERKYKYEYCLAQKLSHLDYLPNKIRRIENNCSIPSNKDILERMLPNSTGLFIEDKIYKISFSKNNIEISRRNQPKITIGRIFLKDDYAQAKIDFPEWTSISGLFTIPVYPWGNISDIMYIYLGKNANNFAEIPQKYLNASIIRQLEIIKKLSGNYNIVYWGMTMTISRMSVPAPHAHISILEQEISQKEINDFRKSTNWDNGLSHDTANIVKERIKTKFEKLSIDNDIETDNIGLSINLKNIDINDKNIHKILQDIICNINSEINITMSDVHNRFYNQSNLEKFFEYIHISKEGNKKYNTKQANSFFLNVNNDCSFTSRLSEFKKCGMLREPASWGMLIRFGEQKIITLYIHFNYLNEEVGPFEGIGIKLAEDERRRIKNQSLDNINLLLGL